MGQAFTRIRKIESPREQPHSWKYDQTRFEGDDEYIKLLPTTKNVVVGIAIGVALFVFIHGLDIVVQFITR